MDATIAAKLKYLQSQIDRLKARLPGSGTTLSDEVLTGGVSVTIPGLQASADQSGTGTGTIAEEYDSSSTNLTWSSAPAVEDSNTTILSHLYVKITATGVNHGDRSFAPSGAFDIRTKVTVGADFKNAAYSTMFWVMDSGFNNGAGIDFGADPTTQKFTIVAYAISGGGFTQKGSTWNYYQNEIYLRITRDGSNNFSYYWSADGIMWQFIEVDNHSVTLAKVGWRTNAASTSARYLASDWLRTF